MSAFLLIFKANYLEKICGYPHFPLWIPIALAKIYFFCVVLPWCKNLCIQQALSLIGTQYQLNKLDHNICLHIDGNNITLLPALEIQECPCLHITPRHAEVHSFIYIILEKLRKLYLSEDILCIVHAYITSSLSYCNNLM